MTSYDRDDVDSNNSEEESELIRQESIWNAQELDYGDLQTYAHRLFGHIKEYLATKGSHLLDRCTFTAFMEYCQAERDKHGSEIEHSSRTREKVSESPRES